MGIKINISKETAESASGYPAIPAGKYDATIKKTKLGEYKTGNQKGKPFYSFQFRIADGEYKGRTLFFNLGLFEKWASGKANFRLPEVFSALGYDVSAGDFEVPDQEELAGKELVIKVTKSKDEQNSMADDDGFVNEINGFLKPGQGQSAKVGSAPTSVDI